MSEPRNYFSAIDKDYRVKFAYAVSDEAALRITSFVRQTYEINNQGKKLQLGTPAFAPGATIHLIDNVNEVHLLFTKTAEKADKQLQVMHCSLLVMRLLSAVMVDLLRCCQEYAGQELVPLWEVKPTDEKRLYPARWEGNHVFYVEGGNTYRVSVKPRARDTQLGQAEVVDGVLHSFHYDNGGTKVFAGVNVGPSIKMNNES